MPRKRTKPLASASTKKPANRAVRGLAAKGPKALSGKQNALPAPKARLQLTDQRSAKAKRAAGRAAGGKGSKGSSGE